MSLNSADHIKQVSRVEHVSIAGFVEDLNISE